MTDIHKGKNYNNNNNNKTISPLPLIFFVIIKVDCFLDGFFN